VVELYSNGVLVDENAEQANEVVLSELQVRVVVIVVVVGGGGDGGGVSVTGIQEYLMGIS